VTTTRRAEHHDHDERRPRGRGTTPFVGYWRVWFAAIPWGSTALYLLGDQVRTVNGWPLPWPIGIGDPHVKAIITACVCLSVCALSLIAWLHNTRVTKRDTFVAAHVIGTMWLAGFLVGFTVVFGWSLPWLIIHFTLSLIGAGSWHLPRIDALRADSRAKDGAGADTFGKLIGLDRATVSQPTIDAHHITAEISPGPGKTMSDVAHRMEAIEDAVPAALPGRSRLERNPITKKIRMVFMHRDPLEPWPRWDGPSHPGGSFADGGVCGRYADAQPEVVRFAKWADANGDDIPAGHLGTVGTTRSGKSGCGAILWTDIAFTRRDVLVVYIDCAKPGQSLAAQVMDDVVLYADGYAKAKALLGALAKLAFARATRMGAHRHNDWTVRTYEDLGLPALLVVIDEADMVCGTTQFRDLVTKCLSAGIFVHALMPRADGDSMDTTARTAMNQWQVFGTGDDYSHTFAMTKRTVMAGGDKVCDWRNTKPGYHFLDGAPGVDESRYAMEIRSLRGGFDVLVPAIVDGRRYRARMHPADIADLGKAWAMFQPPGRAAAAYAPPAQPAAESPTVPLPTNPPRWVTPTQPRDEEIDMHTDPNVNPYDLKDWASADPDEVPPVPAMDDPEPGDVERYANADPDELRPPEELDEPDLIWDSGDERPEAPNRQAAYDAFDLVLRRMADEGMETFAPRDVIARFPFKRSVSWFSERMDRVAKGEVVSPPGLTIERLDRGEFVILREPKVLDGAVVAGHTG
jgi:hypothetical protein